jgi:hypothetical protein
VKEKIKEAREGENERKKARERRNREIRKIKEDGEK